MNTLESFFQWLLAASLRASLLAGAVVCLQFALRRWLPARWRFALWLPVVLVLVAPVLPESRFSVQNRFVDRPTPVTVKREPLVTPAVAEFHIATPAMPVASAPSWTALQRLLAVWIVGVCGISAVGLVGYRRSIARIFRDSVTLDAGLQKTIAELAGDLALRRVPRIVLSKSVASPAVAGLLRPMLLLPANFPAGFTPIQTKLVLMHELTHLKRRDLPMNWLICILQALHWFNPALWIAFARMRHDRETACDAQVLCATSEDFRAEYGHALLKLQSAPSHGGLSLAFVGIFGRKGALRSRIQCIAAHRPAHPAWSIAAIAIMVALTMVGATQAESKKDAPQSANAQDDQVKISAKFIEISAGKKDITITGGTAEYSSKDGVARFIQTEKEASEFLKQFDNADVLASPTIITRSGQQAKINVGRELPMPVGDTSKIEMKQVGVSMEVTPTLDGGNINLEVRITISKVTDRATGKELKGEIPPGTKTDFSEQTLSSKVAVPLGKSAIIGGMKNGEGATNLIILTPAMSEASKADASKPKQLIPKTAAGDKATHQAFVDAFLLVRKGEGLAADGKIEEALKTFRAASTGMENIQETAPTWNPEVVRMRLRRTKEAIQKLEKGEKLQPGEQEPISVSANRMESGEGGTVSAAGNVTILAGERVIKADSATIRNLLTPPTVEEATKADFILPTIELKEASIQEAVATIIASSKAVDPDKKGADVTVFPNASSGVKITLALKDVPVSQALKYVAELSNLKFSKRKNWLWLGSPQPGTPVVDKPGYVVSPYRADGLVDVRGLPKGTEVACPYTGLPLFVP